MIDMRNNSPRIILIDIETSPSLGLYFDYYKEGNIVSRVKGWYILSFSYKWLGEKKTYTFGLVDYKGYKKNPEDDRELCRDLADVLSKADVVVAHNGDGFDIPKINARLVKHGIHPPAPLKTVDTYKVARRYFSFETNRLDDLGDYLGVGRKISVGGIGIWEGCMRGDKKSWSRMKKYNAQDVVLLEKVYLALRPWITNHPNLGLLLERPHTCPICGSKGTLQRRGFSYTRVGKKARYQCTSCGGWSSGKSIKTEIEIR